MPSYACVFSLQETVLLEPMFEVPGSDISVVVIGEDAIMGKACPMYVRSQKPSSQEVEEEGGYEEEELKMHQS